MADGILIGLSLMAGVVIGPLALVLAPTVAFGLHALRGNVRRSRLALVVMCVVVGMWRAADAQDLPPITALAESRGAIGVIASLPVAGGQSERSVIRVEQLQAANGEWHAASGRVVVYMREGTVVSAGDTVSVTWSAIPIAQAPPGYASFLASQRASGSAHVWTLRIHERGSWWAHALSDTRRLIGSRLQEAMPGDTGALAAGIVTGDDAGLSRETEEAFRRSGTSHITAVSGQNIALLLAFCALWMRPSRWSTRMAAHAAMILLVWLYVLMVGLEPPALRAAIVATLTILGIYTGRRPDPLTLLALALGGMLLVDPGMASGAGFWLSAVASYALCSVMPVEGPQSAAGMLRHMVSGTVAASLATMPILIWTFGEWSPVSPLANLLIGPLMTATFIGTYALALILVPFPGLGSVLAWVPAIGLDTTIVIVERVGSVLPLLTLDTSSIGGALVSGAPCFAVLWALSRDGLRWQRMLARRWRRSRRAVLSVLCGFACGGVAAMLISMLISGARI